MRHIAAFLAGALALLAGRATALAQNIDVSTLPPRDEVQLTIYNSEDITLVREKRRVTLRSGVSQLQFSWANTQIDPSSVTIRFQDPRIDLIDTTFPHERNQVLHWSVRSPADGETTAEISYFTSGISWSAEYVGVVAADEGSMTLDGFVTVTNGSGEDYEGASIRMVVGTINLLERVSELAARGIVDRSVVEELARKPGSRGAIPRTAGHRVLTDLLDSAGADTNGGNNEPMADAPVIVKEGLSEYFLFTVPGAQTVKHGWSKRLRLFAPDRGGVVPFATEYRYRPQEYGERLVRVLLVRNDETSSLGESPLPDGSVQLFRRTADDGLSVLGQIQTKYVPIGQEFEFNIGRDPEVPFERMTTAQRRSEFWFRRGDEQRLFSPDKGDRIDPTYAVVGWDDERQVRERVRNFSNRPIKVAWRFPIDGDVRFRSAFPARLHDYRTPEFDVTVKAGDSLDLDWDLVVRSGANAREQHVVLEAKP